MRRGAAEHRRCKHWAVIYPIWVGQRAGAAQKGFFDRRRLIRASPIATTRPIRRAYKLLKGRSARIVTTSTRPISGRCSLIATATSAPVRHATFGFCGIKPVRGHAALPHQGHHARSSARATCAAGTSRSRASLNLRLGLGRGPSMRGIGVRLFHSRRPAPGRRQGNRRLHVDELFQRGILASGSRAAAPRASS